MSNPEEYKYSLPKGTIDRSTQKRIKQVAMDLSYLKGKYNIEELRPCIDELLDIYNTALNNEYLLLKEKGEKDGNSKV